MPAFVTSTPITAHTAFSGTAVKVCPLPSQAKWTMRKVSKFGPFTPALIGSRFILGEKRLNKLRGKGISLHSQVITAFCEFTGAGPRMRQKLIRQAKENGNTLGFLS